MCDSSNRPEFPKRAIITGGMPYGNKSLHFGHVGGMYVHADMFARFLRDRIGKDNVLFVSGTDCYGSPILEDWRIKNSDGTFKGSMEEFVKQNHELQKNTLSKYQVSLDIFAASGFGTAKDIHHKTCGDFFKTLYNNGYLSKREMLQFFDEERGIFLNGRQVLGVCPIEGCKSEKGYADECSLGHQYDPKNLINPKSQLTGQKPIMKKSTNWYVNLDILKDEIKKWILREKNKPGCRHYYISNMLEFFEPPTIHVKKDFLETIEELKDKLPNHTMEEGRKKSYKLIFDKLDEREKACSILTDNGVHFRNGKTLVPFRLTGNVDWGVPVPSLENDDELQNITFWVWPESLWAPISFTKTYFQEAGKDLNEWKKWWCSKDATVFQFIGEDNIYFYGPAEMAMFLGNQKQKPTFEPEEGELMLPVLIANNHILFLDKKASSSGKVKPPMADDLLDHYTSDQLRAHFMSLGLGIRSVGFKPKPFNPTAKEKDGDPVLKEGNLLSNVFNRAIRSCFYTIQKYCDNKIPVGDVSSNILGDAKTAILNFEACMSKHEFHNAISVVDNYIRTINKFWTEKMKEVKDSNEDQAIINQTVIDTFHMVRTASLLTHPIAPTGSEKIREYLNVDEHFWDWKFAFETIYYFMKDPNNHNVKFLEPRVDFFGKHESQIPKG
jgi:methionyl-tRNA synthetase